MMCQSCGKKDRNHPYQNHRQRQAGGVPPLRRLRQAEGLQQYLLQLGHGFRQLAGGLYGQRGARQPRGPGAPPAGASFEEITQSGKIGCADCYRTFRSQLMPVIQRIHGTTRHKGKVPGGSALRITGGQHQMVTVQESPLEEKKRLLKQAIEKQDFEQAAVLRDEIKEMESHD